MSKVSVVLMTAPNETVAASIARTLVEEKLAACGNLIPKVRSIYRWQDEVCDDPEVLVLFKTTDDRFESMKNRLIDLHPYECPEVLQIDVRGGSADYLAWVIGQTR